MIDLTRSNPSEFRQQVLYALAFRNPLSRLLLPLRLFPRQIHDLFGLGQRGLRRCRSYPQ